MIAKISFLMKTIKIERMIQNLLLSLELHMPLQTISPSGKKIVDLFKATNYSTFEAKRVKMSNLTTLLKKVKNSSDYISFEEYKKIDQQTKIIRMTLGLQNSKVEEKKNALIDSALDSVKRKLTLDARNSIYAIVKERNKTIKNQIIETEKNIINAKNLCANKLIPMLDSKIDKIKKSMDATISKFDTFEQKTEAIRLLKEGNNFDFNKESALTKRLFPQQHQVVETEGRFAWQLSDHKDLKNWVSLGERNTQRLLDYNILHTMKVLFTEDVGGALLPVTKNTHGNIELTYPQKVLMDIAKYANETSGENSLLREISQHIENLFFTRTNQYESDI